MAGNLSDYAEAKILDHLLGTSEWAPETNLYVGLSTAAINDASTGGACAETTGTGYTRIVMNTWDAAGATRVTKNSNVITFPEATTGTAWGEISYWFISETQATTDGQIIAWGSFDTAKTVGTGDDASIAAGNLTITVDAGGMSDFLASEILDHIFKNGAYGWPVSIYVGLSTAEIIDTDTPGIADEVSGGDYAREQQDTWNATDTTGAGDTENTQAITFTQASASWGTVTHFFLSPDAATGNILFHGAVGASKTVGTGDTVQFDADTLTISLD